MKIFNLVPFIILYSTFSFANVCSENSCPQGRQSIDICYTDPEVFKGLFYIDTVASCGYFSEVKEAKNTGELASRFNELARSCKSIKSLKIIGHGSDGYSTGGQLDSGTVQELSRFGCLFDKGAEIGFVACSVGQGCSGDMLLYQTAKTLLPRGGSVKAPTWYSSTFLPGVVPSFSLNGKSRKITFDPSKKPSDSWTQTGLAITNGGDINERCSDNLKDLIDNYSTAKVSARKKQCSVNNDYVSTERLESYRRIQAKVSAKPPPYLQSANADAWYDLSSALDTLKYQIRRYEQCEPPRSERNNSRSSDAVR